MLVNSTCLMDLKLMSHGSDYLRHLHLAKQICGIKQERYTMLRINPFQQVSRWEDITEAMNLWSLHSLLFLNQVISSLEVKLWPQRLSFQILFKTESWLAIRVNPLIVILPPLCANICPTAAIKEHAHPQPVNAPATQALLELTVQDKSLIFHQDHFNKSTLLMGLLGCTSNSMVHSFPMRHTSSSSLPPTPWIFS